MPVTVHLGDVSEAAITQFIADRKKAGHAASSINHSLQILKQASRPVVTGPQDIGALRSRTGNPRENGKDGFIWCARQESNLRPLASEAPRWATAAYSIQCFRTISRLRAQPA